MLRASDLRRRMTEFTDSKFDDSMSWLKNIFVVGEEPYYTELSVKWHEEVMATFAIVEGNDNANNNGGKNKYFVAYLVVFGRHLAWLVLQYFVADRATSALKLYSIL